MQRHTDCKIVQFYKFVANLSIRFFFNIKYYIGSEKTFDKDQTLISNLAGQGQELKSSSDTNPSLH